MSKSSRTRSAKGLCCSCAKPAVRGSRCQDHWDLEKARAAQIRQDVIARGICGACRKYPIAPDSKASCQACNDKSNARRKSSRVQVKQQKKVELIAASICTKCKKESAQQPYQLCETCMKVALLPDDTTHYEVRRTQGRCTNCPAQAVPGRARCEACSEKRKLRYKNSGKCPSCGQPVTSGTYCESCKASVRARYNQRKTDNLCVRCGKAGQHKSFHCEPCYAYVVSRYGRVHRKVRKQILEAYGGKCACCAVDKEYFLQVDHINNDGNIDRRANNKQGKNWGGATKLYLRLRREGFPKDRYQLLCANCNWAKHRLGHCPCQD
jgi:hypothetical protein